MTGITKFTKTGVFSAMNNLYDISMDDRYTEMLGYTEEELLRYFDGHVQKTAQRLSLPEEELVRQIRLYYDGFSFDGFHRLYNPFSTLSFFQMGQFDNFWFESGSPSFLINYVKKYDKNMTLKPKISGERSKTRGSPPLRRSSWRSPQAFSFRRDT